MSAHADGSFTCDKCGTDCGNGGVYDALVVSDIKVEDTMVVNLHFCRGRYDDQGAYTAGCDGAILSPSNMANFLATQGNYERPVKGTPPPPAQ